MVSVKMEARDLDFIGDTGSFSKMTYLCGWQVGAGCWQENTVHHGPLLRTAEVSSKRAPPPPEQMIKLEAGAPVSSRI